MKKLGSALLIIGVLLFGGYLYQKGVFKTIGSQKTLAEEDVYVRFGMEAYDSIRQNYWQEPLTYDLPNMFKLSLERVTGKSQTLSTTTRDGVAEMLFQSLSLATSTEEKKNLTLNTLLVVLYNLQPAGRNGILSTQEEKALRDNVANIDTSKNLYQNLGLEKGASKDDIETAYKKKESDLKKATSTEAKAELEQVTYAKKVLTNPDTKVLYDQNQVEPTVWPKTIGSTLYLYISKISPTTFYEFAKSVDNASTTKVTSLILDMRGNVGGSLDFVQNFLGLFMGQNQYAFDLFHQGKYEAQRTVQPKFSELDKFKEVAVITDGMSQSTAEVISSTFKRLRLGKIVGVNTRGWGTVENTYPLKTEIDPNTKHSLLLVNSITLREDNQPIEGRGVDPDVRTDNKDWQKSLLQHFRDSSIIEALKKTATNPPIK